MNKLVVITTPYFFADEASLIELLFAKGMSRLHLRKPDCKRDELEGLLDKISPAYYDRIVLHDWFTLAEERALGGVHLNRRNPEAPPLYKGSISRSCHSLEEIIEYDRLGRNLLTNNNEIKRYPLRRCRRSRGPLGKRSLPSCCGSTHKTIQTITSMALNYYFGNDGNGRVGRRTTGLRPPFGGSNRLMFITHRTPKYTECDEVRMAIQGGCSWIQLRMKDGIYEDTVRTCATICAEECERIVDFCVNDDLEAAVTCGATACHLGKNDMPLDIAWEVLRDKLDSNAIFYIGATANTFEDIRLAVERGASYIGLGPYRFTGTKKNLSPILGLDGYRKIIAQCKEADIDIPIFAIGGITLEDVGPLMETGITGIAVSGAIINASDPVEETRQFIEEINKY